MLRCLSRLVPLAVLLAACAALAPAQDPRPRGEFVTDAPAPEYDPASWKEFSSKEGRFKVLLPGAPVERVQAVDSPYGKVERHDFGLQTFAFYAAGYIDFPERDGIRDVNTFFAGVRASLLRLGQGELLEERADNRFAGPGRFIKVRYSNGSVNRARLLLLGRRFYMLYVLMPEKGADAETLKFYEKTATKFLDSFEPERPAVNTYDRFGDPRRTEPPGGKPRR